MMRWVEPVIVSVTVTTLAGAMPDPTIAAEPDTSWLDESQLEAREVLVESSREGSAVRVATAALIAAPVEAIWEVLKACEMAPEYVPNVIDCRLVDSLEGGKAEVFAQTIRPIFFMPRFEHVFRLDYYPYERIDVQEVRGPIDRMEGSWWLLPREAGTVLLVHSLEVDPGFPVPRFVLRATMRRDLVSIMEAIRDRSEARDTP
jgi:hypothetical protein